MFRDSLQGRRARPMGVVQLFDGGGDGCPVGVSKVRQAGEGAGLVLVGGGAGTLRQERGHVTGYLVWAGRPECVLLSRSCTFTETRGDLCCLSGRALS